MTDQNDLPSEQEQGDAYNPDTVSRVIMLVYGVMENGGPFWCYVAVKPSQYDAFKKAESEGSLDLYNFGPYGEIIVSAEGETPPAEVTQKVAEMYNADPSTFFQPIDPKAVIDQKISELKAREGE